MKHNMKIFIIAWFILLLLTFNACKHGYVSPDDSRCKKFPKEKGNSYGGPILWDGIIAYKAPYFNPNNGNEFVYIIHNYETEKYQLAVFDIAKGEKRILIHDFNISYQPKWSKKNWIAFSSPDHQIRIIKPNGDSLRQITSDNSNRYPEWNSEGTQLIFHNSDNSDNAFYVLSFDMKNNKIDTLIKNHYVWLTNISDNNKVISLGINNFEESNLSDLTLWTTLTNDEITGFSQISNITWDKNNTDIYFSTYKEGLFRFNTISKKMKKIGCGCDTERYEAISASPDGKKLIVDWVGGVLDKNQGLIQSSEIWIMNTDGTKLEQVPVY